MQDQRIEELIRHPAFRVLRVRIGWASSTRRCPEQCKCRMSITGRTSTRAIFARLFPSCDECRASNPGRGCFCCVHQSATVDLRCNEDSFSPEGPLSLLVNLCFCKLNSYDLRASDTGMAQDMKNNDVFNSSDCVLINGKGDGHQLQRQGRVQF